MSTGWNIRYKQLQSVYEQSYCGWIKRFILYHHKRHPVEMGTVEVTAYLSRLTNKGGVSAATHGQALSALLTLYKELLGINLPWLSDIRTLAYML
jgi:hypothetical protein